jgi:hypothetical protein
LAKDGDSDRVVENQRVRVIKLMGGTAHGNAKCST